jgi:hypothetical protein
VGAAAAKVATPALFVPRVLADWADAQIAVLPPTGFSAAQLLTERAAISGYVSRGAVAPGGSCRLLDAADGGIALNLARDDDWDLLPAWLETDVAADWDAVAVAVRGRSALQLVERGREIGLAVGLDEIPNDAVGGPSGPIWSGLKPLPQQISSQSRLKPLLQRNKPPRVIDLSSLWAGPLCGHLLQRLGAEVVKVESTQRPDGARRGPSSFFDLLNAGKASVALDFTTAAGRAALAALIESADIVIEGSRPRALRQLGIDAAALCARRPGLIWIGITAYGRAPATENWIGYGDDVGVAAGLTESVRRATGVRRIVGDAIADPLTGIRAARLAWEAWRAGSGGVLDVSLYQTVRAALAACRDANWGAELQARPPLRRPAAAARPLGADTVVQLREAAARVAGDTALEASGEPR